MCVCVCAVAAKVWIETFSVFLIFSCRSADHVRWFFVWKCLNFALGPSPIKRREKKTRIRDGVELEKDRTHRRRIFFFFPLLTTCRYRWPAGRTVTSITQSVTSVVIHIPSPLGYWRQLFIMGPRWEWKIKRKKKWGCRLLVEGIFRIQFPIITLRRDNSDSHQRDSPIGSFSAIAFSWSLDTIFTESVTYSVYKRTGSSSSISWKNPKY